VPFYDYCCKNCGDKCTLYHGAEENPEACPSCGSLELVRHYGSFFNIKKIKESNVGKITEKAIEDSREELREQKKITRKDL